MKSQFIIAAPASSSGKTTFTLAILRAMKNRGLLVQPFKCGPDFIDPQFHQLAAAETSINLDMFMMDWEDIRTTYNSKTLQADVSCIEGVMGLFDGAVKAEASTAELAKKMKLPVVLVVDAKAVAYSVAPLLFGFKNFDRDVNLAGVVFNRVETQRHFGFLKSACDDVGVHCFGYLPSLPKGSIRSRHLGLDTEALHTCEGSIEEASQLLEKTVDLEAILSATQCPVDTTVVKPVSIAHDRPNIAVVSDGAFNFSYAQNIDALKTLGKVSCFSLLSDNTLPEADLVYIPGGYPESYLQQLAANTSMLASIKGYANAGGKILAECGGMMYLGKSITTAQNDTYPMANVFGFETSMQSMKLHLGYRTLPLGGHPLKGHEFHYSTINNDEQHAVHHIPVLNAENKEVDTQIYRYKNVVASYIHFYFGTRNQLNNLLTLFKIN